MLKSPRRLTAVIALLTAIGCGDDGGTDPAGTITVSASPTALTVQQGSSGTVTATLVRGGGFDAAVNVSVSGLPNGVTATVTPSQLTGTTTQATVTVNVANTVAPGTYTATITATAAGIGNATTTYSLTVTAAPTQSVTLAMNPTTLSIAQGGTSQSTLTATRTNYTGNITPAVTGNPTGMTVTFNPTPMTANTSTVTVTAGAGVAPGNYTLTIAGNTGGAAGNPTTTLGVTVTQASGANITWDFCAGDDLPIKFWKQDGGTWTEVAPTIVGNVTRYSFTISSVQGGVAYTVSSSGLALRRSLWSASSSGFRSVANATRVKALENRMKVRNQTVNQSSPFFDTVVLFALASELGTFTEACATAPTTVSKSFTVSGQNAGDEGMLGYGGAVASLSAATTSYTMNVVAGTYDWLALWGPNPSFPDLAHNWNAYRIGRGATAPGAQVAIARAGASAFVPFAFTVSGGATGSLWNFSQNLEGANGEVTGFPIGALVSQSGAGNMLFLQPADRLSTDMNLLSITNTELQGDNISSRSQIRYVGSAPPASGTFALPAAVPAFTVSPVNGAAVPSWVVTGQTPAEYQTAASVISVAYTGANGQLYTIAASRAWQTANNMNTSYTLTQPTLPGFLSAWAAQPPLEDATVIMIGANATATPTVGTVANLAFRLQSPP